MTTYAYYPRDEQIADMTAFLTGLAELATGDPGDPELARLAAIELVNALREQA